MRSRTMMLLILGALALGAGSLSATPAQAQQPEQWRYVWHNSEWWYWMPESRWVFWRDSQWKSYDPSTYALPGASVVARNGMERSYTSSYAAYGNQDEIGPYYGRALSHVGLGSAIPGGENIGPYYGHALQREAFGFGHWAGQTPPDLDLPPYYGHAISEYGR